MRSGGAATTTTGCSTNFWSATGDRAAQYFSVLEPRFNGVRADCDRLLRINQEAMRRKAAAASATARRWFFVTLGLLLVLMVSGVAVEVGLSNAILGPVRQLTAATLRIAGGELDTSVPVQSADEIGALATGFNRMAERIRELRRSDQGRLLVAQQMAEAAIDSLYDPVMVTDSERRVTRVNHAAELLFGQRADIVGKPIEQVATDTRIVDAVTGALRSKQAVALDSVEPAPWAPDGDRRTFRIRSTPMRDADDRLLGAVTLLEDVTHLGEIERMKTDFVNAASRELREPLTRVQTGIHLLIEGAAGPLGQQQEEILYACRADTDRLDVLMRELLDLSRLDSGAAVSQRRPVRPSMLIREPTEALRLQVEARGVRLDVDVPPDLPEVLADSGQIARVVTELITNAAQVTPAEGAIAISATARDGAIAFTVSDTGAGIPSEQLLHVFEPFTQSNDNSLARPLRLLIARRIVEAQGGTLTVQSQPERGSAFVFTLPIATGAEISAEKDRSVQT